MEVFRICNKDEIDKINSIENLSCVGSFGSSFIKNNEIRNINNHSYVSSERYLHFFKSKGNILYWYPKKGRYVCTYDLPDNILNGNLRYGKYISVFNYERIVDIEEYAVLSKMIKKNYLIKIEVLNDDIDFCDDDYYSSLDDFLDVVYGKGKNVKVLRKKNNLYITS